MTKSKRAHGGVEVSHTRQLPRLRRIEGQVRGLQQMIDGGRDCLDVTHQISAVIAALRRVQGDILSDHIAACARAAVTGDLSEAERRRLAEEVGALMARLT